MVKISNIIGGAHFFKVSDPSRAKDFLMVLMHHSRPKSFRNFTIKNFEEIDITMLMSHSKWPPPKTNKGIFQKLLLSSYCIELYEIF